MLIYDLRWRIRSRLKVGVWVLVPGILLIGEERFHVDDPLLLKRPGGTKITTTIGGLEILCPNPWCDVVVLLKELSQEDVSVVPK
jgi:hypothetical protein